MARGGAMDSGRSAALIGAGFGLVFVLVNAGPLGTPWGWLVRVAGIAAFGYAGWRTLRSEERPMHPRESAMRTYWSSVVLEVVALVVGSRWLTAHHHGSYGVALVAVVVGVHFLPFAWAFGLPSFTPLGLGLIVLGLVGAAVGLAGAGAAAIALVAGVGSGALLLGWAAAGPGTTPEVSRLAPHDRPPKD